MRQARLGVVTDLVQIAQLTCAFKVISMSGQHLFPSPDCAPQQRFMTISIYEERIRPLASTVLGVRSYL